MATSETPAAAIYRLRCDLELSQDGFAERFGLSVYTVRNIEQGRTTSRAMQIVLAAIDVNAAAVAKAAARLNRI